MNKNICIITGSNGYLGKQLKLYFEKIDWNVIEFSSSNKENQVEFNLRNLEKLDSNKFENCKLLIHSSYDFSVKNFQESYKVNVEGSEKLFKLASKMKVQKIIHISSTSSFNKAKSIYGRTKFNIEQIGLKYNVINLRPGILFGDKSRMIDKLENICKKLPLIPIIGNGNFKLHLSHYEDLFNFIIKIYEDEFVDTTKIFYSCTKESITFKNLIKRISGNKITIPIPKIIIITILKLFDTIGIKFALDIDNLYGLILYSDEINFESSQKYEINFRSL
jgi:nucleoside-diphosphate-sugar epimerase